MEGPFRNYGLFENKKNEKIFIKKFKKIFAFGKNLFKTVLYLPIFFKIRG